jgi:hypothetical protein
VNKWLPVGIFLAFFAAIAAATFYYAPSWGLMDDYGLLKMAREFKESGNVHLVTQNFITSGMLRPFYYSWAALFYGIFEHWPTGFYLFVAACNMLAMVFWGIVFFHLFQVRREDYYWTVFFYPLAFFLFTAFWNIFNYLSLQEKFVVFFAPLAIYFFQKVYRDFRARDIIVLYLFVLLGLMSKATFVFVPFAFFVYAFLDLMIFHYRPQTSWLFVFINGAIFAGYTAFTFLFQLKGNYTAKYKNGLAAGAVIGKIMQLSVVMKFLLAVAVIGLLAVSFYALTKKREVSLGIIIYLSLMAYVFLLLPWGFQSYLVSAIGPLALGALFPVYAWLNRLGGASKVSVNVAIAVVLVFVFTGNIVPNIARMGDIGRVIAFLRDKPGSAEDMYFMPPPYGESADAAGKFTKKKVFFCGDGKITADRLSVRGNNYVVFSNLFSAVHLSGVAVKDEIFSNATWKVFTLTPRANEEDFAVAFPKSLVQQLKVKIREM